MTKHEIIDAVAAAYTLKTRSVSLDVDDDSGGERCLYNGPEGRCCAFAMFVKPEFRELLTEDVSAQTNCDRLEPLQIMKKEVKAHTELLFWLNIQRLHDRKVYWDRDGLSDSGKDFVKKLKSQYPNK